MTTVSRSAAGGVRDVGVRRQRNRLKRWAVVGGHDFKHALLDVNGFRNKSGEPGIICYNCGVWTISENFEMKVQEFLLKNRLMQCPYFHGDLFGGAMFKSKGIPKQIPRTRRKKRAN